MDKRVILAVAGSGKTYHICNSLNPEKKNLILAFTHENIHNIVSELVKAYGKVPELTTVMTFDAFKYRFLLKPYEFSILSSYFPSIPSIKGITTINSPKNSIVKNGKSIHNPLYINKPIFLNCSKSFFSVSLSQSSNALGQNETFLNPNSCAISTVS